MLDSYNVSAEVAGTAKTKYGIAYRVKAKIPEHGFWINGMMVYPPNIDHDRWGLLPPGIPHRPGKFVIEFDHSQNLWLEVERECIAVAQAEYSLTEDHENSSFAKKTDVVITDIPDEPITLDDIPDFN